MNEWFIKNQKKILIVSGHHGTGKTHLVELMCKKYHKTMYIMHSNTKRSKKEITSYHDQIKHFTSSGIFILDDFELFITKHEYVSVHEIFKLITTNCDMKTILVVNLCCLPKLHGLSAESKTVILNFPSAKAIFRKCLSITEEENINLDDDGMKQLKKFIEVKKNDVRMILDSLNIFQSISFEERTNEMDMYDTYENIINNSHDLEKQLCLFSSDSGTIPIISQENYIDYGLDYKTLWRLSESMSNGDVYHKSTFMMNSNMCIDVYGCLSTLCLSVEPLKKTKKTRFGLIWTKQSASYQKKKYISDFQQHTNIYKSRHLDYLYLSDNLKHIVDNKDACELNNFLVCLNISDVSFVFSLYNAFTLRENIKQYTKKTFVNFIKKLSESNA